MRQHWPFDRAPRLWHDLSWREAKPVSKAKEELTKLIEEQPGAFHVMVHRGLADSEAGRVISNDEMARRIRLSPSPQSRRRERKLN